tara:strand:- start:32071 stop:32517 length:447 start_codon:yes stop_codon:yes gene_type:complete
MANWTLFSPLKVRLMNDGIPLLGKEIVQKVSWNGIEFTYTARTNFDGEVSLPDVSVSSFFRRSGRRSTPHQIISTMVNGRNYILWDMIKPDLKWNSELQGDELDLLCDLNHSIKTIPSGSAVVKTRCTKRLETTPVAPKARVTSIKVA